MLLATNCYLFLSLYCVRIGHSSIVEALSQETYEEEFVLELLLYVVMLVEFVTKICKVIFMLSELIY